VRRRHAIPLAAAAAALALSSAGCGQARGAWESFTLDEHDKIIAEAPGCHAECSVRAGGSRECTIKEYGCRPMCSTLPECRPAGKPIQVCAVVKSAP
jgi:hypothetical protein